MKKFLFVIVTLLSAAASAFAVEVEIDGLWYEVVTKGKVAKVIRYKNDVYYKGDVVIPETVAYEGVTCSVMSIEYYAFENCSGLTSVTIGNSVTSIENHAFYKCYGLTSVTIGNSVTSIGKNAFDGCSGLTSITIGNSVTSIGVGAFNRCSGLNKVIVKDIAAWCGISFSVNSSNPLYFAHRLYSDENTEITELIIPNSVTSIGNEAFDGCSGLTSVTIGNSVTRIGDGAFLNCSGLTSVTFPSSVTSIGYAAFDGCSGLTSITIGNSVTSMGDYAFYRCSGLTSVTIPNSVTSIGECLFSGCSCLTSVVIGGGVKTIGSQAFAKCEELNDVTCYAENVPSTWSNAFEGSYIEYVTLHVPAASVNAYKSTAPWSGFKTIVGIEESTPDAQDIINGHEYIDLGLSSGKLWSKTNLGATSETQYGNYINWSSNDIVTEKWGDDWGTPSYTDYVELINSCNWTWETKNGTEGYVVTGKNDKSIFFPAAGFYMMGITPQTVGKGIYYWTNSMDNGSTFVYMLSGNSTSVTPYGTYNIELISAPIRPIVITKTSGIKSLAVEEVYLDIYDLNGIKREKLQKGLNIIRMSNGKTKKVLVK